MTVRRAARLARVLFFDGFRAAPGWMALMTGLLILGSIAATCYPLGYRLLVDGALARDPGQSARGIAVVAVLASLGWLLTSIGATDAMALYDRIALYRIGELVELTSGIGGLEHLERSDYLGEVERLTANRRQLATAPRMILSNLSSVARIVALLVLLASVSFWLLLLPLSAVPPMVADRIAKRITKRAEDDVAPVRRLAGMVFGLASDAGAAGEVRSYGLGEHLAIEHRRLTDVVNRRTAREALQVLGVQAIGWLLYAAALMAAVAFVVFRATHGALTVGTVVMAVSLIRRSRTQLASAAQGSGAMVATLATVDRLFWLQDYAAEQTSRQGTEPPPDRLHSGIRLDAVTFAYPGTDRAVLDGFDLDIPAGSTVALIGENGSGKTTLVKLLLAMYRPSSGQIRVDSRSLQDLDLPAWRARCSAAFQDFSRFHLPAVETIGVADLPAIGDEGLALSALERAGMSDLTGQLPEGLATRVGTAYTGGRALSGGQWQKLALARAMRRSAPLLVVLDEPTASLDPAAEHRLFESYAQAAARTSRSTGAITVLVSHRFSTVRMADLIVYLEHGQAAEVGSHQELFDRGGRYRELYDLQAAGYR